MEFLLTSIWTRAQTPDLWRNRRARTSRNIHFSISPDRRISKMKSTGLKSPWWAWSVSGSLFWWTCPRICLRYWRSCPQGLKDPTVRRKEVKITDESQILVFTHQISTELITCQKKKVNGWTSFCTFMGTCSETVPLTPAWWFHLSVESRSELLSVH